MQEISVGTGVSNLEKSDLISVDRLVRFENLDARKSDILN